MSLPGRNAGGPERNGTKFGLDDVAGWSGEDELVGVVMVRAVLPAQCREPMVRKRRGGLPSRGFNGHRNKSESLKRSRLNKFEVRQTRWLIIRKNGCDAFALSRLTLQAYATHGLIN